MSSDNPVCPSCGKKLSYGALRCDVCKTAINPKVAGTRLSDKELSEKLMAINKKQMFFFTIGFILLGLSFLFLALPNEKEMLKMLLFFLLFLAGILVLIASAFQRMKIKKLFALNTIQGVLNEVLELHEYTDTKHIDAKIIAATQLLPDWNICNGNDYVSGIYRGLKLAFSDIQLHYYNKNDDDDNQTLSFKGQWISCGLEKEPGIHMLIRERSKMKLKRKLEKTRYELMTGNAAFDERFQVISADPDLALRFLTPHIMGHIVAVATAANARIYLYIGGMWLHVAVNSKKELFEVGKSAELADIQQLRARLKSELRYVTGIVDELLKIEYLFGR